MENVKDVIGIDISKLTFDAHCHIAGQHKQFSNNLIGFKQFFSWAKQIATVPISDIQVVMEHTGLYSFKLEQYLSKNSIRFSKRSALDIRRSAGLIRGKTDKADARTIAKYGWQKRDELSCDLADDEFRVKLRSLLAHRELLVGQMVAHKASLGELKHQLGSQLLPVVMQSSEQIIMVLERQIKSLEKSIEGLITEHKLACENYALLTSVKGIGFVTAAYMLLYTNNFKSFDDARKFNSYCGIAPYEYGSGTSIKGKTKVSPFANKRMKSLLHQAAIIATVHDPEIRAYFQRKKAEGKNKMCVYNAVRTKLVARMFAVIKRKTPFLPEYTYAA